MRHKKAHRRAPTVMVNFKKKHISLAVSSQTLKKTIQQRR